MLLKWQKKIKLFLIIFLLCFSFCGKNVADVDTEPESDTDSVLLKLSTNYIQMPEQDVAISRNGLVYAQYSNPTNKYTHTILGDSLEATQLVVWKNNVFYKLDLDSNYVFEDIRPRLFDVDNDGELEFIAIRTHLDSGAGIVIYKMVSPRLSG